MDNILIDRPAPFVARIRINRPAKLNAVDFNVREEITEAFGGFLSDKSVRALVFGGVDGNLSAGGDVPSMIGLNEQQATDRLQHIHNLCRMVADAPFPIVTAAQGWSAGASVGLALLGDAIIVGPGTKFLVPFFKLGLVPDWGMLRSLPARIGLSNSRKLIFDARPIEGQEALDIGLADYLVDDDKVADEAIMRAEKLTQLPQQAFALVKQRWQAPAPTLQADLLREEQDQVQCLLGDEFREGFAGFTEKRPADFTRF